MFNKVGLKYILASLLLCLLSTSIFSQNLTSIEFLDSLTQHNCIPSCKNKQFSRLVKFDSTDNDYYTSAIGWYSDEDQSFTQDIGYVTIISNSDSLESLSFEEYVDCHFSCGDEELSSKATTRQLQTSFLKYRTNDLVLALWAFELGEIDLANFAYKKAMDSPYTRTQQRAIDHMNNQLAWNVYFDIVNLLENGDDQEANECCKTYLKYHLDAKRYPQAKMICEDIKRRVSEPKIISDSLPEYFDSWNTSQKLNYLIGSLDQLNGSSSMWLTNFGFDYRCKALAEIGKPAIDTLIYCIEHDTRLTRASHSQRYFTFNRTVLSVSEASLNVIQNILKTTFYTPPSTSSTFTSAPDKVKKEVIQKIKDHWRANKNLKLEDALMNRVKDVTLSLDSRKEALKKLVYFPRLTHSGSYISGYAYGIEPPVNTLITEYKSPSISDMIFEIMRIDLDTYDPDSYWDSLKLCGHYATLFKVLQDTSVIPQVSSLFSSERNLRIKVDWALVNYHLGDPKCMEDLIELVENNNLKFDNSCDKMAFVNCIGPNGFSDLLGALRIYGSDRSKSAINQLSNENNEFGRKWKERVYALDFGNINYEWIQHTQGIKFLTELLIDTTIIGNITMRADSQFVLYKKTNKSSYYFNYSAPDFTYDYTIRDNFKASKKELAADHLYEYILGLPQYNPIMARSDSILNLYQQFFDRYKSFEKITEGKYLELGANDYYFSTPNKYIPKINLTKPATNEDLKKGNAIFSFEKKKMSVVENPPEVVEVPIQTLKKRKINGFVLQAEKDRKDRLYYGVVSEYGTYILEMHNGRMKIIDSQ